MKIAVIGTGYVGLVAGACFAGLSHVVTCIDKDKSKIVGLKKGVIPIHEPDLPELVAKCIKNGKISFSTDLSKINESEVVIIAVGTPATKSGAANLKYLNEVVETIALESTSDKTVVIKSTVPVGTATQIKKLFQKLRPEINFEVISNPEFLREGSAVNDFMKPDRVVVGCSKGAKKTAEELYKPLTTKGIPLIFVTNTTAELIKYSANCYLAMRIAFINEMADLAEKSGADIEEIARGMGHDKRIGLHYLKAGPGYGGSCFPKDTLALVKYAKDQNSNSRIIEAVIKSNKLRKEKMAAKVIDAAKKVKGKNIAILGLAFKADTDDLRDGASITIINKLLKAGLKVRAYDPSKPYKEAKKLFKGAEFVDSMNDALKDADVVCVVTEWSEFKELDFTKAKKLMKNHIMVDLRNIFAPESVAKNGFKYISVGRQDA